MNLAQTGTGYEEDPAQKVEETVEDKAPYRWPLDIYNGYSSSFQEFRSSHFHGGIDLRTYQKTGFPVYAVADGYIYRLSMMSRGSGRGLYLKHKDGNYSIYYHLDRFEKRIEDVLQEVQKVKRKKNIGDHYLKSPVYYKKGEVIAYSGETGAGFAHLHFEIRDENNTALNPFPLIQFPAKDKHYPRFAGVLTRNRGDTLVNGKIEEQYIRFNKKGNDWYELSRPLLVTGPFDLVLRGYDLSDTGRNVAPYSLAVQVAGRFFYHLSFDRFEWDDNNQLGFVYDIANSNPSLFFFNLFFQEGFSLEEYKIPFEQVFQGLANGKHQLKIIMKDYFGNQSTGVVTLYKVVDPVLDISGLQMNTVRERSLTFNIETLDAEPAGIIKIYIKDRRQRKISSGTLQHSHISETKPIRLTNISSEAAFLEFEFFAYGISYVKKQYLIRTNHLPGITDIPVEVYINRDDLFVKVLDPLLAMSNLKLKVIQGDSSREIEPRCSGENIYFRFKPLTNDDIDQGYENRLLLHLTLFKDGEPVVQVEKKYTIIHLKPGHSQRFSEQEFSADFASQSVYEPKVLLFEEKNYPAQFPVLSRQISLSPYFFPFLDTVFYEFRLDVEEPQQVAIFKYHPRGKYWTACNTFYDAGTATYKTRLISSGTFALMRDSFPPRIGWIKPATNKIEYLKLLTVIIADKGKGVNDTTINIWLNQQLVVADNECEYDADHRWVQLTGDSLKPLRVGENILTVRVKDYGGNITTQSFRFHLRSSKTVEKKKGIK